MSAQNSIRTLRLLQTFFVALVFSTVTSLAVSPPNDFSPDGMANFLGGAGISSMEGLIAVLPEDLRRNWILMTRSESAQAASPSAPRIILQSNDAKTLMGFSTERGSDGKYEDLTLEVINFDDASKRFRFYTIDFEGRPRVDKDDSSCRTCHGQRNPRPNWDAYDSWANMLPFNRDRLYKDSEETEAFRRLAMRFPVEPRLKPLILPPGVSIAETGKDSDGKPVHRVEFLFDRKDPERQVTGKDGQPYKQGGDFLLMNHTGKSYDEGRGVALFDNLTQLNAQRVAQEIKESRGFARFKFALLGVLEGCITSEEGLSKFVPESTRRSRGNHFGLSYSELLKQLSRLRQSLPRLKEEQQRTALRELILANAKVERKTLGEQELKRRVEQELLRRNPSSFKLGEESYFVDREIYDNDVTLTLIRYLLEPEGITVSKWSLSARERSGTYTFADLFNSYKRELLQVLRDEANRIGQKTSCDELAIASRKAMSELPMLATPEIGTRVLGTKKRGAEHE